jgi:hypothetical protein
VGLQQEIARADAYIAQTNRRIAKHHGLIRRSRDVQTIAITRDLLMVLAALRGNVENRRRWLQQTERPTLAGPLA